MKILLLTHFYPPEPCAAATRVASLRKALLNAGHEVTTVTNFPSFPASRFADGERWKLIRTDTDDGARIVRLFSVLRRGFPGARFIHWLSSALAATAYVLFTSERYDCIVTSMPPVTLTLPALAGAWRHRARLVVDIRDVFPDIAVAMGEWSPNGTPARATGWLMSRLYRRASIVAATTPTALEQISRRGTGGAELFFAPNSAEEHNYEEPPRAAQNGFTAIYAGNLGLATDIDTIVDAAKLLLNDGITITVAGDGAQRDHLRERIHGERVYNVLMRESLPREEAMHLIAIHDVSIVALRKGIDQSVPTKLYDALALGCPVIVAASGEARKEAESLGAFCSPPGDAAALAAKLRELAKLDRGALRERGQQGKALIRERGGRMAVMSGFAARISSLATA